MCGPERKVHDDIDGQPNTRLERAGFAGRSTAPLGGREPVGFWGWTCFRIGIGVVQPRQVSRRKEEAHAG